MQYKRINDSEGISKQQLSDADSAKIIDDGQMTCYQNNISELSSKPDLNIIDESPEKYKYLYGDTSPRDQENHDSMYVPSELIDQVYIKYNCNKSNTIDSGTSGSNFTTKNDMMQTIINAFDEILSTLIPLTQEIIQKNKESCKDLTTAFEMMICIQYYTDLIEKIILCTTDAEEDKILAQTSWPTKHKTLKIMVFLAQVYDLFHSVFLASCEEIMSNFTEEFSRKFDGIDQNNSSILSAPTFVLQNLENLSRILDCLKNVDMNDSCHSQSSPGSNNYVENLGLINLINLWLNTILNSCRNGVPLTNLPTLKRIIYLLNCYLAIHNTASRNPITANFDNVVNQLIIGEVENLLETHTFYILRDSGFLERLEVLDKYNLKIHPYFMKTLSGIENYQSKKFDVEENFLLIHQNYLADNSLEKGKIEKLIQNIHKNEPLFHFLSLSMCLRSFYARICCLENFFDTNLIRQIDCPHLRKNYFLSLRKNILLAYKLIHEFSEPLGITTFTEDEVKTLLDI